MHGTLFVSDQNMLDLILFEQLVINEKNRAARITENVLNLFFL